MKRFAFTGLQGIAVCLTALSSGVVVSAEDETGGVSEQVTAAIELPKVVFSDEHLTGTISLTNNGQQAQPGAIYIRLKGRNGSMTILEAAWPGAAGQTTTHRLHLPAYKFNGQRLELIHRDETGRDRVLAMHECEQIPARHPRLGQNILRNAGFELPVMFSGCTLGRRDADMRWKPGGAPHWWRSLPVEGWWAEGDRTDGISTSPHARSGKQSLRLDATNGAITIASSLGRFVPKGKCIMTAYVRTQGAEGVVWLDVVEDINQARQRKALARGAIHLPADTDWTRVTLTTESPGTNWVVARFHVGKGVMLLDDVQVEVGEQTGDFNVRPQEYLRLSFDGYDDKVMPKWLQSDAAPRKIRVHNDSRRPLTGRVTVQYGPWNVPDLHTIGEFDVAELGPGESRTFEFTTAGLRTDAYVAIVRLKDGAQLVTDGAADFNPHAFTGWNLQSVMDSRSVTRFVVIPRIDPKKLFGVGNAAQRKTAAQSGLSYLEHHLHMRQVGVTCLRTMGPDENECWMHAAAGGIPLFIGRQYDSAPPDCDFNNPCSPSLTDVYDPRGVAHLKRVGEEWGRELAANPMVVGIQLANENYWANAGVPCPTKAADDHFRAWCQARHGDLQTLNARWGTDHQSWDEVAQVISKPFHEDLLAKKNVEFILFSSLRWSDWPREALEEMDRLPGKTMDWLRWRTQTGVDAYGTFRDACHIHDDKTLYSTDLPIPTFRKQFFIPFVRRMDAAMINSRYTSGYDTSYGTPHEHMCDLEMSESIAGDKPFWGIEMYFQPSWPAEAGALHNWGLIAHGMSNVLVFAWGPFSDSGVPSRPLEWLDRKPDPHGWYLIDVDGAHVPAFDSYARSAREVQRYHEQYDGTTIRRVPTDVAFYIANDTCEHALLTTKYTPWGAVSERACFNLIYLLRLHGITADFVDDVTLPDAPGRFKTIVVPLSDVLSQPSAERIARFARSGGTVVLAGACGRVDPWLRPYKNLGGPAWAELDWKAPNYIDEFAPYVFDATTGLSESTGRSATDTAGTADENRDSKLDETRIFRGANFGRIADAQPMHDAAGNLVGWRRPWGKGTLIAYGMYVDTWTRDPHPTPQMTAWMKQLIDLADLHYTGRWTTLGAASTDGAKPGTGAPVVDLVVRVKSPTERFVFALNQGGRGSGVVEVPVSNGTWQAEDVIDPHQHVGGAIQDGVWRTQMALDALSYRVIRLYRASP